jgi:hypothetical protein
MSLFRRIFGRGDNAEASLLDLYSEIWARVQGSSPEAMRTEVAEWIAEAKRDGQRDGDAALPADYGAIMLGRETADARTPASLAPKRAEGVMDADIRWWWGLNYIERRLMLRIDNLSRMAVFTQLLAEHRSAEDAARHIWRYFPNYGNDQEVAAAQGDDRPIPYELKDRVNTWLERHRVEDPAALKQRLDRAGGL